MMPSRAVLAPPVTPRASAAGLPLRLSHDDGASGADDNDTLPGRGCRRRLAARRLLAM
jgi:hypothetical protein